MVAWYCGYVRYGGWCGLVCCGYYVIGLVSGIWVLFVCGFGYAVVFSLWILAADRSVGVVLFGGFLLCVVLGWGVDDLRRISLGCFFVLC